ncbi:hypothetical protein GEMRC1_007005 [Eukaryota sp. GEM-RC1]
MPGSAPIEEQKANWDSQLLDQQIQRFKHMPRHKSYWTQCCCTIFVLLILGLVGFYWKWNQCNTVSHSRSWVIEDVSAGFRIRSRKGTFITKSCPDCLTPQLELVQYNARDSFPEPKFNSTSENGIYEYETNDIELSWIWDCYVINAVLLVPPTSSQVDDIDIHYTLGLTTDDFPEQFPIYINDKVIVPRFKLVMEKETASINKLVTELADIESTLEGSITFQECHSENCGLKSLTHYGNQNLKVLFEEYAHNHTIQMSTGSGNIVLEIDESVGSGLLNVTRYRGDGFLGFRLNRKTLSETPYSLAFGDDAVGNVFFVEAKSRAQPGEVSVTIPDDYFELVDIN